MSQPEDEEDDLDGILDSALDEFDIGPITDSPARGTAGPSSQPSEEITAATAVESGPKRSTTDQRGREAIAHRNGDGGQTNDNEGVRAFENALKKLEELHAAPDGGGAGVKPTEEEEDLRLVEDFLKSLSSQFENVGPAPDGQGASQDAISDDLSRELAALFSGSEFTDGGPDIPGAGRGVGTAVPISDGATSGSGATAASVCREPSTPAAAGAVGSGPVGPEFEKIVESVVGELLSKEVLKGPMQEMRLAYEQWLPENESSLNALESRRYRKQQAIVGKICALYESGNDSPSSVMTLLQEMQDTGAPPSEVIRQLGDSEEADSVGAMPSGPLGDLEKLAKCPVQ
jgi:hypothetical protein